MTEVPKGHVIAEIIIDNVKIKFCDDAYIEKTPEQLNMIEAALVNTCYRALKSKYSTNCEKKMYKESSRSTIQSS